MEYKRFEKDIVLRVDPGEDICDILIQIAESENFDLAEINGLGAICDFTAGVFDTVQKKFNPNRFRGSYEIVSLNGTITKKDGKPYLHVHLSAGDENGNVRGGHLARAVVSATAEIVIRIIDGKVGRKMNEQIGLNLFDFFD